MEDSGFGTYDRYAAHVVAVSSKMTLAARPATSMLRSNRDEGLRSKV